MRRDPSRVGILVPHDLSPRMATFMTRKLMQQDGASSVEYAMVMLLTALVLVFALVVGLDGLLDDVPTQIQSALP